MIPFIWFPEEAMVEQKSRAAVVYAGAGDEVQLLIAEGHGV